MSRIMYDAVVAANCPGGAPLYAGYMNGNWPNADEMARRHGTARIVRITITAGADADVLDVETGDASPNQAPPWSRRQRGRGAIPTVYCNASTWPQVRQAFLDANIAPPCYWIAQYDNNPAIPAGAIAKQYATGNYDTSSVADLWPGIDPQETTLALDDADKQWLQTAIAQAIENHENQLYNLLIHSGTAETDLTKITAKIDAVRTKLGP